MQISRLCLEHFGLGNDNLPPVLHRSDIVNRRPPFDSLLNPEAECRFNEDLVGIVDKLEYIAITAIIDKLAHLRAYTVWHKDPYHYCLEALLERYVLFLEGHGGVGDVMIEARNKKLDKKIKKLYGFFFKNGNQFMSGEKMRKRLTSAEIKLRGKSARVAGLQLCDLLAHPASMMARAHRAGIAVPTNFGGRLGSILEQQKYRRSRGGRIEGWGLKWLP